MSEPGWVTCCLCAQVNETKIVALFTCGEPPWGMTRCGNAEYVLLYETTGRSYSEARGFLREMYPKLFPELSKLFPFPGGKS